MYHVTVEYRHNHPEKGFTCKEFTLALTETAQEAYDAGNSFLEKLEARFTLHEFPSGLKAKKERFSKNGGAFGTPKHLITNMAYLNTPFAFFAKVTKLNMSSAEDYINSILNG